MRLIVEVWEAFKGRLHFQGGRLTVLQTDQCLGPDLLRTVFLTHSAPPHAWLGIPPVIHARAASHRPR